MSLLQLISKNTTSLTGDTFIELQDQLQLNESLYFVGYVVDGVARYYDEQSELTLAKSHPNYVFVEVIDQSHIDHLLETYRLIEWVSVNVSN